MEIDEERSGGRCGGLWGVLGGGEGKRGCLGWGFWGWRVNIFVRRLMLGEFRGK